MKINKLIEWPLCLVGVLALSVAEGATDWPVLKTYEGEFLRRVKMPIGGIGTGTVSLNGTGGLVDWEIRNRPAKAFGVARETEPLWPDGKMPAAQARQTVPRLEWCEPPKNPIGTCVILVSGGSYECLDDIGFVRSSNERLTELGCQCANLIYRTPRPKGLPFYASARMDAQRAIRLVRRAAARRGFDSERIGMFAMSAGSHLALLMATSSQTPAYDRIDAADDVPAHLDFALAGSPAYVLENGALSDVFRFDAKTCPVCFTHGGDDPYSPLGSTAVYRRLRHRKIPAELHLYGGYGHTFLGLERGVEFLRQLGFLGAVPPEEERRIFRGNHLWKAEERTIVVRDGRTAKLTWYIPFTILTRAIQIVFPGGAYTHCNAKGEGLPVAEYLSRKGMSTVVVEYRVPRAEGRPRHALAWEDARRAIEMVKREAPSVGLDPNRVGVMGFSAGGHLALLCATSAGDAAHAVQWAVPVYPGYTLAEWTGENCPTDGTAVGTRLADDFAFDRFTPPMCLLHGDADFVPAMGSVLVWEKLRAMGVSADLHTLATRSHCFQFTASPGTGSYTYLDRVWDFLTTRGFTMH